MPKFVLISRNRTAVLSDKRADLDLPIAALTECALTEQTEVATASDATRWGAD